MKGFTNKEIIKAFEEKVNLIGTMTSVYLDEVEGLNLYVAMNNALGLLNRQQAENNRQKAEIEKLQLSRKQKLKEIERLKKGWKADVIETENIKSEAIKEYMKILEEKLSQNTDISNVGYQSIIFDMEQGYKEMVGDK